LGALQGPETLALGGWKWTTDQVLTSRRGAAIRHRRD
jgi:hypothetical protein